MSGLKSELLFELQLQTAGGLHLGDGPLGYRAIGSVVGGDFTGPRLSGKVLPGGGDWLVVRSDETRSIDARVTIEATDGSQIYMTYSGRICLPPTITVPLDRETIEDIDPETYYFRSTPLFEVRKDSPLAFLNGIVAVGIGRFLRTGVEYRVFHIQ